MITIELPWYSKNMSPNIKKHWAVKAKAKGVDTNAGYYAAFSHRKAVDALKPKNGKYLLDIIFHPPVKRKRDADNAISACKGLFDGMAQALGVDDSLFKINSVDFGEVVKGGKIVIKIY